MSWNEVSIENSDFPESLKTLLAREGFVLVREVLGMPVAELVQQNWFTVEMLEEIQRFIRKHKPA